TKTPTLQLLAFVWIGQNIFSAISVGSRNWQYIYNCGLAYKRVGVFLFLMITIVGLIFLFLKVKNKKTFFFVTKRTLWAAYAILLAASFVNWDVLITRFNLTNPVKIGNLDTYFLTRIVSEKNIPVLLEYKDVLIKAGEAKIKMDSMANRETSDADYDRNQTDITVDINNKCRRFVEEQKQYSFLSWNVADYTVKNTLSQKVVF
ncbi:MAG: hypothetical protein RL757_546, partial [Bacteroidota bacterium]